ncbi:endo alpha-1,4 polygalactosaminidase [Endozoicomonas sp. Mp262]|uniref:bifunctional glycoside hydrolase 114/ polysaccharide deacetylase family protein n=1 Tax=Endozoicomonas sp. Mp262 TaxID=2919499 RepID=UPI0021DB4DB0
MIRGCLLRILVSILLICTANLHARNNLPSVAFYYGHSIPAEELSLNDQVVVEPAHLLPEQLKILKKNNTTVFAYLSLGEVSADKWKGYNLPDNLVLGKNKGWNSQIIDLTNQDWHNFVLNRLIPPLKSAGYDGLFLDTLDSYQIQPKDHAQQRKGLVKLIKSIKKQYPGMKLFMNRGFELFPDIADVTDALAAESLLRSFDPVKGTFRKSTQDEQNWLLGKLNPIKAQGIPITIIDYLPGYQPEKAQQLVKQITQLGFSPWISTPALDSLGTGLITPKPRKVLMLYNGEGLINSQPIHTAIAVIAEYLGLSPVYINIDKGLPNYPLAGRFAGVINWINQEPANPAEYQRWLGKQLEQKVPILFMGIMPITDTQLLKQLGLKRLDSELNKPVKITQKSPFAGEFEAPIVRAMIRGLPLLSNKSKTSQPWITLKGSKGQKLNPVLIAEWGGMALTPYVLTENGLGQQQWLLDPFTLVSQALKIKPQPIPDSTTENGRRILTSHVDGDGFASKAELPGTPYSGTVIKKEVFERYPIPHTVSIVEGETGKEGLYPWLSPTLESIARDIFKLPNVELATHSYSHPFYWQPEKTKLTEEETLYGFHLPIKGYKFDLKREILGSIDYINNQLAPSDKKVKVFLWTGDALPSADSIALTKKAGVVNLNGGNSKITNAFPSITGLDPQGRPTSAGWQIYAPIMNENVYTNNWTGPFYGFRKAIETFELTDYPRRIKPITIYWHFYSGTKASALYALQDLYDWSTARPTMPLYISEYSPRVEGFYTNVMGKNRAGQWEINELGDLRTLRVDKSLGWPAPACSTNLAGFRDLPQGRYLHLSGSNATLCFTKQPPKELYLEEANAPLKYWHYLGKQQTSLRLKGHMPIEFTVVSSKKCFLETQDGTVAPERQENRQSFSISQKDTGDAILVCR